MSQLNKRHTAVSTGMVTMELSELLQPRGVSHCNTDSVLVPLPKREPPQRSIPALSYRSYESILAWTPSYIPTPTLSEE